MQASSIVTLVVAIGLGFIPASIAGKKGYSKVGFYFYSLFMFLPALVHALVIPDKLDQTKRQYRGKELTVNILAAVFLHVNMWISLMASTVSGYMDPMRLLKPLGLGLLLVFAVIFARQYIFSILVYALNLCIGVYDLIVEFRYLSNPNDRLIVWFSIATLVFNALVYVALIYIAVKYGKKGEKLVNKSIKPVFLLPALFVLASGLCIVAMDFSLGYLGYMTNYVGVVFEVMRMIAGTLGFLLLGVYYYEDCRYPNAVIVENV